MRWMYGWMNVSRKPIHSPRCWYLHYEHPCGALRLIKLLRKSPLESLFIWFIHDLQFQRQLRPSGAQITGSRVGSVSRAWTVTFPARVSLNLYVQPSMPLNSCATHAVLFRRSPKVARWFGFVYRCAGCHFKFLRHCLLNQGIRQCKLGGLCVLEVGF